MQVLQHDTWDSSYLGLEDRSGEKSLYTLPRYPVSQTIKNLLSRILDALRKLGYILLARCQNKARSFKYQCVMFR